jgi:hypothetical protein
MADWFLLQAPTKLYSVQTGVFAWQKWNGLASKVNKKTRDMALDHLLDGKVHPNDFGRFCDDTKMMHAIRREIMSHLKKAWKDIEKDYPTLTSHSNLEQYMGKTKLNSALIAAHCQKFLNQDQHVAHETIQPGEKVSLTCEFVSLCWMNVCITKYCVCFRRARPLHLPHRRVCGERGVQHCEG